MYNRKGKRVLSFLLSTVMLVSNAPANVFASGVEGVSVEAESSPAVEFSHCVLYDWS